MSHSLKQNTTYSIVTMDVAIPCTDHAELADWLNETMRPLAIDGQIADYSLRGLRDVRTYITDSEPEEGDCFIDPPAKPTPSRLSMFLICAGDQANNLDLLCAAESRENAVSYWCHYYGLGLATPERVFTLPSNSMDQSGAIAWPDMACWNPNVKPIR